MASILSRGTTPHIERQPNLQQTRLTGERYGYAGNDPVNRRDPTGLSWIDPCIGDTCASDVAKQVVNTQVTASTFGTANCIRYVTCAGSTPNAHYSAGDVWRSRGTIATVGATAWCILPGLGWASCAAAQGFAFGLRAQQRVGQQGFGDSLGDNAGDLGLTAMFLWVGGLPQSFGGLAGMSPAREAFYRFFLSGPDIGRSIADACSE